MCRNKLFRKLQSDFSIIFLLLFNIIIINTRFILQLINIVEYFKKCGKKILVLTRKHQKKLSVFKHVERNAFVFLVDNL